MTEDDRSTMLKGLTGSSIGMFGGFFAAIEAAEVDRVSAGLFVGIAGVIGTLFTSMTPWVKAWFEDRKEERQLRAAQLKERLEQADDKIARLESRLDSTLPKVEARADSLLGQADALTQDLVELRSHGFLKEQPERTIADSVDAPRLLIVEDNAHVTRLLRRMFSRHGFTVMSADTVSDALAMMDEKPVWILVDLRLGEENGLSLIQAAKELYPDCKVAVVTGEPPGSELCQAAMAAGPDEIFHKPVDPVIILAKIRP